MTYSCPLISHQVYNVSEGRVIQTLKGHKDTVHCVAYARDGEWSPGGGGGGGGE